MQSSILGDRSLRGVELLRILLAGLTYIWMNTANHPVKESYTGYGTVIETAALPGVRAG